MRALTTATAGFALALSGCSSAAVEDEPYDMNNAIEANAQCEHFTKGRLKSPASAEFDLSSTYAGDAWVVTGTVDSQNGFGAMLRNDVECVISMDNERSAASLVSISIG